MELARDEHGSDAQQLELFNSHMPVAEVTVCQVDRGLDRLGTQLELDLDDEQPVNEDFAVFGGQLLLCFEVVPGRVELELLMEHCPVDGLDVVSLGELVPIRHPHVADCALGQPLSINVLWSWCDG